MKLLGNASVYLGSNILNASIPFLLLPILTRVLTPTEYGTVAMFWVMVSIFSAFTGLSVHGAISVRYFQLEKKELADYVGTCVGILIFSTTVVIGIVMLLDQWVTEASGIPMDWLIVSIIVSGVQFLINIRLSLWQVLGMPWYYGSFQISRSLLDALISLILIFVLNLAWQGRLIGQSVAIIILGITALIWLYKDQYIRLPNIWKRHAIDALRFGLPLIPHIIGGLLIVVVDRIIITNILGKESAGIYMIALQLGQALGLLTDAFNKAYAPWLFAHLSENNKKQHLLIVKGTYIYFLIIIIIGISLGLAAPYIIRIIAGESFWLAGDLAIYLTLGFAFGGCYYMVVNYIFFKEKTEYLFLATLIGGLLNIPITYILTKEFGLEGAAISLLITKLLTFVGAWILSNKVYSMPWLQLNFPKKSIS